MAGIENNGGKKKKGPPKGCPPPNPNGRPKGVPNKTTTALKEAILLAAQEVGFDGNGKEGLPGYLKRVAIEDIKAFSGLLGKVLPMQVTGDDNGAIKIEIVRYGDDKDTE